MSSRNSLIFAPCVGLAALTIACAGRLNLDPSDMSNPQGTQIQGVPRRLGGFYVDATVPWSHQGAPLGRVAISDGALVVHGPRDLTGASLVGAAFSATLVLGDTIPMRIARVVPHKNPWQGPKPLPGQVDYVIEYSADGEWRSLCPAEA